MSPQQETGCSEVSTTVTLLDGNNTGVGKDDSSRSATNSPSLEQTKQQDDSLLGNVACQKELNENQNTRENGSNKAIDVTSRQNTKDEVIDVEDSNDCKDEDLGSRLKKYDYLGLYNNRTISPPEHSRALTTKYGSNNNNRKTNNSKVRICINTCRIL